MSEFDLLAVAADGMSVQRALLDVAARNVAAAQASTPQHPYPRLVARFAAAPDDDDPFFDVPGDGDEDADDVARTRLIGTVRSGERRCAHRDDRGARRAARVRGRRQDIRYKGATKR